MEEVKRLGINARMINDICDHLDPKDQDNWNRLLTSLIPYTSPIERKTFQRFSEVYDTLERKGYVKVGENEKLIEIFDGIEDKKLVDIVKRYQSIMNGVDSQLHLHGCLQNGTQMNWKKRKMDDTSQKMTMKSDKEQYQDSIDDILRRHEVHERYRAFLELQSPFFAPYEIKCGGQSIGVALVGKDKVLTSTRALREIADHPKKDLKQQIAEKKVYLQHRSTGQLDYFDPEFCIEDEYTTTLRWKHHNEDETHSEGFTSLRPLKNGKYSNNTSNLFVWSGENKVKVIDQSEIVHYGEFDEFSKDCKENRNKILLKYVPRNIKPGSAVYTHVNGKPTLAGIILDVFTPLRLNNYPAKYCIATCVSIDIVLKSIKVKDEETWGEMVEFLDT